MGNSRIEDALGDLLSQWRAYANDGSGLALQFDAYGLRKSLPVAMRRVEYRERRQAALVRRSLERFASFWDENDARRVLAVIEVLPYFAIDLASLKHPAFF